MFIPSISWSYDALSGSQRASSFSLSLYPRLKDKQAHKYTLPDWVRLQTPVRNQTPSPQQTRCSILPLQARRRPTSTPLWPPNQPLFSNWLVSVNTSSQYAASDWAHTGYYTLVGES